MTELKKYLNTGQDDRVVHEERNLLKKTGNEPLLGLALSGGGIRSATFCLGVLQALARKGVLEKFDYLSTVSGGGYIGSSLSWLLYEKKLSRPDPGKETELESRFDLSKEGFPFGTMRRSLKSIKAECDAESAAYDKPAKPAKNKKPDNSKAAESEVKIEELRDGGGFDKVALLRYLRQHGDYLLPGDGIGATSFFAVFIRGLFIKALVYFPILVALFIALLTIDRWAFSGEFDFGEALNWISKTALGIAVVMLIASLSYAIGTYFFRWYRGRRIFEIYGGRLWRGAAVILLIGTISFVEVRLGTWWAAWASTSGGVVMGLWAFAKSAKGALSSDGEKKWQVPMGLVVTLASALLIYGLFMLAFKTAKGIDLTNLDIYSWIWIDLLVIALIAGALSNLNHLSIHRYYRDRLMETYMPDVDSVMKKSTRRPGQTKYANEAYLHHMVPGGGRPPAIYHLINANLVLVNSKDPKYRGRGGDNFILSPLFCGSKATGWRRTGDFMKGKMNLPTAMSISGAAVNPSTGVGGQGPTRNRLLSFLLSLLNIRLGFWAPNPDPKKESMHNKPNFLRPGVYELISKEIDEKHPFVQLSDGGHFENLGIYELIRRKCKLILVCDCGADSGFYFGDLANATEKVRADFGAKLSFNDGELAKVVPNQAQDFPKDTLLATQGHCRGEVTYIDGTKANLILVKSTLTKNLPSDIYGYRSTHTEFPDETTADQFFDERQFEAYRELGYSLGINLLDDNEIRPMLGLTPK